MADVEERMEAWVEETGIRGVFEMMTIIAQVMELVRDGDAGACDGEA